MLQLTCRCGWSKSFDPSQIGIQINCPECDRDFPITDDPVAFSARNTGVAELSFAEEIEVPEEPKQSAPRTPRPNPGSSHSPGASVSYRPTTGSRTLRNMKKERRVSQQRSSVIPIVLILVGVAIVGAIAFSVLRSSDRTASLEQSRAVTEQAIEALKEATTASALGYFTSAVSSQTVLTDFAEVREKLGHTNFEFKRTDAPAKGSFEAVTIVYTAKQRSRGVECKFDVVRVAGNWKIKSYSLRDMTPTEL